MLEPTHGGGSGSGDDYGEFKGLLDQLERHADSAPAATRGKLGEAAGQICDYWPTLRTVLEIVLKLPFIPSRVKDIIRDAIPIFDGFCKNS